MSRPRLIEGDDVYPDLRAAMQAVLDDRCRCGKVTAEELLAAAITAKSTLGAAERETCPRCRSDTCPGRDDVLDCTAAIDGLYARDEARRVLADIGRDASIARGLGRVTVNRAALVAHDHDCYAVAEDQAASPRTDL